MDLNRFDKRVDFNRFSKADKIEFPSSSICLAVCKASASSACPLVTKPALGLFPLYYRPKFKDFTNIFLLNKYAAF